MSDFVLYEPEDIVNFGKEKGHSIKQIFQFDPQYVEWIIEYTDIYIDLDKLQNIKNVAPIINKNTNTKNPFYDLTNDPRTRWHGSVVEAFKNFIEDGGIIDTYDFKFSEKTTRIIEKKKMGTYIKPTWEKPRSLTFEELRQLLMNKGK